MESNYEYLFFKYLCEQLELNKFDDELQRQGIRMVDENNSDKRISKYFSLVSRGDINDFSQEMKEEFKRLFDNSLENVLNNNYNEAIQFIVDTYKVFYHLNGEVEYKYYGPANDNFLAPSNCIVLGLNYFKFNLDKEYNEESFDKQETIIVKTLNFIQGPLAKQKGFKIATIAYNEISLSQPFVNL